MAEWKGSHPLPPARREQCGAQYKIGTVVHVNTLCQLRRNHLGKHIAGSMLTWARDNEEMDELLDHIDAVQEGSQR